MIKQNLLLPQNETSAEEAIETLVDGRGFRLEKIVSLGHVSPAGFWYDQPQDEWLTLLQGSAQLEFDNEPIVKMKQGDALIIKAHQRHRVAWTDPNQETVWLALHFESTSLDV